MSKAVKKTFNTIFAVINIAIWFLLAAGGIFYVQNVITSHFAETNTELTQKAANSNVFSPKNILGQPNNSLVGGIINNQLNPTKTELIKRSEKIGDFTEVPDGYYVTNAVDALGLTAVIAEHPKTEQYMAIIDTGWALNVEKNDIQTDTLKTKLLNYAEKVTPSYLKINSFIISPRGYFSAFNQQVPYGVGSITIQNISTRQIYEYSGIIGIVSKPNSNKNDLIISVNLEGKLNRQVAEEFFKKVKLQ